MASVDKNTILNVIVMFGIFNFVFLISYPFFVEHFTSDVFVTGFTLEKPLVFIGAIVFSFVLIMLPNHQIRGSSKKQALIALMISLITTFVVVLYTSI